MVTSDRTWSQFILDATVPTLLARYNHRTPFDFINRIVSTKQSTSPTSAEYIDNQTLMNNVLQKLKQEDGNEIVKHQYKTKLKKTH